MGSRIKGNSVAMAMVAYLMSSPHSNMIGIYRLPMEYVKYDTGLSEAAIRDAFAILKESEFAFYDDVAQIVYIPSYAAIQVAPSLSPKDNRHPAVQREVDQVRHLEFKNLFLARYGKLFNLSRSEGASGGSGGAPVASQGASEPPKALKPVDKSGAMKGLARDNAPVPVPVIAPAPDFALEKGVKRGLGREEEKRPLSKTKQFFESWPDHMMNQSRKTH